jgi:hypothetical protein
LTLRKCRVFAIDSQVLDCHYGHSPGLQASVSRCSFAIIVGIVAVTEKTGRTQDFISLKHAEPDNWPQKKDPARSRVK